MRYVLKTKSYVVHKYLTGTSGNHFYNATDVWYMENQTSRFTDAEVKKMYDEYESVGQNDSYEIASHLLTIYQADNKISFKRSLESVSCYGERTIIIYAMDPDLTESDIRYAITNYASAKYSDPIERESIIATLYAKFNLPYTSPKPKNTKAKHQNPPAVSMDFNVPCMDENTNNPGVLPSIPVDIIRNAYPCCLRLIPNEREHRKSSV